VGVNVGVGVGVGDGVGVGVGDGNVVIEIGSFEAPVAKEAVMTA
jgi:hypothetical protein